MKNIRCIIFGHQWTQEKCDYAFDKKGIELPYIKSRIRKRYELRKITNDNIHWIASQL